MTDLESVRVDSWLWAVRVYSTRSAATTACRAGHVRLRGDRVKASAAVHVGDEVRIRIAGFDRVLVAKRLIVKRVGAPVAVTCFEDLTPPAAPRDRLAVAAQRDRGAGRPTKRDRREIERLRGRESGFDPFTADEDDDE